MIVRSTLAKVFHSSLIFLHTVSLEMLLKRYQQIRIYYFCYVTFHSTMIKTGEREKGFVSCIFRLFHVFHNSFTIFFFLWSSQKGR